VDKNADKGSWGERHDSRSRKRQQEGSPRFGERKREPTEHQIGVE